MDIVAFLMAKTDVRLILRKDSAKWGVPSTSPRCAAGREAGRPGEWRGWTDQP